MAQWTFNALGECTFIYIVLVYQAEIGYLHSVGVNLQWTDVATFDYRGGGGVNCSHLLSTTETRDKHWFYTPTWL